jgi:hypothetical protein
MKFLNFLKISWETWAEPEPKFLTSYGAAQKWTGSATLPSEVKSVIKVQATRYQYSTSTHLIFFSCAKINLCVKKKHLYLKHKSTIISVTFFDTNYSNYYSRCI